MWPSAPSSQVQHKQTATAARCEWEITGTQEEAAWHYAHSRAQGIYLEGWSWPGGAAVSAFVSAPFHQLAGQERQTEESNSIPVPVPTAPPSAQRSWTDQPRCGEEQFHSFSSFCVVWDGARLKVRVWFACVFLQLFQLNGWLSNCRVHLLLSRRSLILQEPQQKCCLIEMALKGAAEGKHNRQFIDHFVNKINEDSKISFFFLELMSMVSFKKAVM